MRRLMVVMALAALVAACSEQPTQPTATPQGPAYRSAHAALVTKADAGCVIWNADGSLTDLLGLKAVQTGSANAYFGFRCFGPVQNPERKIVHFDPAHPPYTLVEYETALGVDFPNGLVPICDWNSVADPTLSNMTCTTNWHAVITPSGNSTLEATFDPAHSWTTGKRACDIWPDVYTCPE